MATRRFLAPAARSGNGHGFYSQPQRPLPKVADETDLLQRIRDATSLCDEPEAPSGAWVNADTDLAKQRNLARVLRDHEQACLDRRMLNIENRIRDAERRAKAQRLNPRDVNHEMFLIRKMLNRGNEPTALGRLEQLEARLDGVPQAEAA